MLIKREANNLIERNVSSFFMRRQKEPMLVDEFKVNWNVNEILENVSTMQAKLQQMQAKLKKSKQTQSKCKQKNGKCGKNNFKCKQRYVKSN